SGLLGRITGRIGDGSFASGSSAASRSDEASKEARAIPLRPLTDSRRNRRRLSSRRPSIEIEFRLIASLHCTKTNSLAFSMARQKSGRLLSLIKATDAASSCSSGSRPEVSLNARRVCAVTSSPGSLEDAVVNGLCLQAAWREAPEEPVLGVDLEALGAWAAALAEGAGKQNGSRQTFHTPTLLHELRCQVIQ